MTSRRHSPNLLAIRALTDQEIQFYAILGACVSLVSAVEHGLFECYISASGLLRSDAAAIFYKHVNYTHKRDTVDEAVRTAISSDARLLARWNELLSRAQGLLGPNGARNLLGHNYVQYNIELFIDDASMFSGFNAPIKVSQNTAIVDANIRPKRDETFESLYNYAQTLERAPIKVAHIRMR